MAMLRKSGLMQLLKFRDFINKQGGDISKKLKDKTAKNVLDHSIEISDPKPWSDKQLHKLYDKSLIYEEKIEEEKVIYIIYTMEFEEYWKNNNILYNDVIDFYNDIKYDVKYGYEVYYSPSYPIKDQETFIFVFNRLFDVPQNMIYKVKNMTKRAYSLLKKWDFIKVPDNDVETFINAIKYNL